MKHYVLIFVLDPKLERVALKRKSHPTWQLGLLNGMGGKIEAGELPAAAALREFEEETTGRRQQFDWEHKLTFICSGGTVFVYTARAILKKDFCELRTREEDEPLKVVAVNHLPNDMMQNLRWLIPLVVHGHFEERPLVHQQGLGAA